MTFLAKPLRLFFHLLYHSLAWGYDAVAGVVSLGNWQKWVLAIRPYVGPGRVLELGHGPGHLQAALLAERGEVFGLDESRQMGRIAIRRLRRRKDLKSAPKLVRGLAQRMPFPDGCIDQIVATFPSEYIFAPETLAEINRILRIGGKVCVLLGATPTGKRIEERMLALLYRVTGESPDGDHISVRIQDRLKRFGMEGETRWEEAHHAKLLIVVAQKVVDNSENGF